MVEKNPPATPSTGTGSLRVLPCRKHAGKPHAAAKQGDESKGGLEDGAEGILRHHEPGCARERQLRVQAEPSY